MPKWVRSLRVCRVSSNRMRSADFNASTARGDKSERLPIGVPMMRSFPDTRRSLLQALLRGADRALELVREHDQHLGQLFACRTLDLGLIEKETQLGTHAAGELGDARKSERSAGALQLVGHEEKLWKGALEASVRPEVVALLAEAKGSFLHVVQVVAPQRTEFLGHQLGTSEKDALSVCLCVLCGE